MSRRSTPPVSGKVAVITGAARGLGAGMAEELHRRGAKVALLGLEPELLAELAGRLGDGARSWQVDVTDADALARVATEVEEHYGRIDIVVANAGIGAGGTVTHADPASYERTIEVNLFGSIRTVRAFLPAILSARGYVLQIASIAAMMPTPTMSAYCASKSGVEAFAHALRGEIRHHGCEVGVAYLPWTDTDMVRGVDAIPGMGSSRTSLPWPFNLTAPLGPSVLRLVDGIARRSAHVYGQAWVRAVQPFRPFLPGMVVLDRTRAPKAEAALLAAGEAAQVPVGAGGAADAAARQAREAAQAREDSQAAPS